MKQRITITDIAKELNITPATVSRALSDSPEISLKTKKIVRAAALRLDYHPNKIASSLRSGKSRIIGVLIPAVEHVFFGSVISGITNMASKNGFDVLIYQSNESYLFEKKGIQTFISAGVDGILVSIAKDTKDYKHFTDVKDRNIPIAFFDRVNDSIGISSVSIDDYQGAYMATESLIKEGYKNIAYISGPKHIRISSERLRGYKDALKANGLIFRKQWVYEGDISIEAGRKAVDYFMGLENKPDGLICIDDMTAIGALQELKLKGIEVPKAVGVIGFCNDPLSQYMTPSLSSIDQQTILMGEEAFTLISGMIDSNKEWRHQKVILAPILITRNSSKRK